MPDPLVPGDFAPFFQAVHGHAPFAWQQGLAHQVVEAGQWPDVIDVPTGLGKTAVVDIAVFALAAQAYLAPPLRTAPMRTFIAVDRRVIVDQTHDRSLRLAAALHSSEDEAVARVASALRHLSRGSSVECPLVVERMRGGTTWSARWLISPAQPAVVTGTVDQLGSRLLFRGYGVNPNQRPIDAALCGADSLLVLDEAHLSGPFVQTMTACQRYEALAAQPVLARRNRPVLLSATPPADGDRPTEVFRLDRERESSPAATDRLDAHRFVHLIDLAAKGKPEATRTQLASALAAVARARLAEDGVRRVAVVCNTVGLARLVHRQLEPELGDVVLVTGRCRPIDRERIAERWLTRLTPDERDETESPIVVVATQTIEVGADFDFDALVTEIAPLDALLQRLGRLDRRGSRGRSDAHVIRVAGLHGDDTTMVYGGATGRTWEWLCQRAGQPLPVALAKLSNVLDRAPSVDLGFGSLSEILSDAERADLSAHRVQAPIVLGPTLDGWARTSPSPEPDQEVAAFLHGIGRSRPMVSLCWRDGLPPPVGTGLESWQDELQLTPPAAVELVEVPIGEASAFLAGRKPWAGSDIEGDLIDGDLSEDDDPFDERVVPKCVVVLPDGTVEPFNRARLRPGTILVLPSSEGGHDEWGWSGDQSQHVVDIADLAGRRPRLRPRPAVLTGLIGEEVGPHRASHDEEASVDPDEVIRAVIAAVDRSGRDSWYAARLRERLASGRRWKLALPPTGARKEPVLEGRIRCLIAGQVIRPGGTTRGHAGMCRDERHSLADDVRDGEEGGTSGGATAVSLDRHLRDVNERARSVGAVLGLPAELVGAVAMAGQVHDLGKADLRFQVMLHRGDRLRFEAADQLLAKSGMDPADRGAFRRAQERSGWPRGMRHEAVSAALLDQLVRMAHEAFVDLDVDLVRHLVASHHGFSRPLLPPVPDPDPVPVAVRFEGVDLVIKSDDLLIDWEAPSRFERLCRSYGRWGLALLEAIVRLADISWSIEYEEVSGASGLAQDDPTEEGAVR